MSITSSDDEMMRENQRKDRSNDASDIHKLKKPLNEDGRFQPEEENSGDAQKKSASLAEYAEHDPRRRA
ncbi:hypothetical protein [Notoacmeibacter sp. MSK16QG-6]|uniref:hypothetical protein n=1 Tax=Notoacmeibacter sp. MSK16QG-6 TaxID=2957982 RepID=UPI00209E1EE1|nr:hypothetical protein [Notoacmeibacter sp. MSK16QG-6]MCP1198724.1 hypothetical protein [Notoacmeibacter sp. MSK16QG-6]